MDFKKTKSKIFKLVCITVLMVALISKTTWAQNIVVSMPKFDVTLNGVKIENRYRNYPLIVYKDITYFPMTYTDSRFLGIETKWDNITGLSIIKSDLENSVYVEHDLLPQKNLNVYNASIPSFKINVNGKLVDNSKEEYPLLVFRDVTYFPLTWRFAVEEFGWNYKFNNDGGLIIKNPAYSGPEIIKIDLPIAMRDSGSHMGAFTVKGDYFYYEGLDGIIYKIPTNDLTKKTAVYELPLWTYGDSFVYPSLDTIDNKVVLSYHQGGASMGTDYEILLNDDDTNEIFSQGYLNKKILSNKDVYVPQFVPPSQNLILIRDVGEEEYKPLGEPNYYYGGIVKGNESSKSYAPTKELYLLDDKLYILATNATDNETKSPSIHSVNINTGETMRLCEQSAKKFAMVDNVIYFMDMDGFLFKLGINETKAEKIHEKAVKDFEVINHHVFYVSQDDNKLYKLGEGFSVNPASEVESLKIQEDYLICQFDSNDDSTIKIAVFNNMGKEVFRTIKNVSHISISNNRIFYLEKR